MMHYNDEQIDKALGTYFRSKLPDPFPKAPIVFGSRPKSFTRIHAKLALAASMLILFALGILWPKNSKSPSGINFKSVPTSASDDKRHKFPMIDLKNEITPKNEKR
jgi:hypothetical protein